MPQYNRRDFLSNLLPNANKETVDTYDINNDELFKKYSNKLSPLGLKKSRSGLSQYTGAWGIKQKMHLMRRLSFGVKPSDLAAIGSMTMVQTVDAYLNNVPTVPPPPLNYYDAIYPDPTGVALGFTWINAGYGDGTVNYYRQRSVKARWMKEIVNQGQSIIGKLMLFWHNHFVTAANSVGDARMYYKYMELLRADALGNFKTFVKDITLDPQMLYYLNGHYNVASSPDENYARELQELFTLGKGANMWTETDVKLFAKVLTGFRVDVNTVTSSFDPAYHDSSNKVMSAFYNNNTIPGQTGAGGAAELDLLIDLIFSKDTVVAKFICRKLYRFFVYYDIDATVESTIIDGLAQTFIANNWNIKPVLSQLFKSDHFFDTLNMDCYIRTPMDYFLGLIRTLDIQVPSTLSLEDEYSYYSVLATYCELMGMDPGDPPNVAGWVAFYQSPGFHEMWINSDSLPKRMKYSDYLFTNYGLWASSNYHFNCDVIAFVQTLSDPTNPVTIIDECVQYFLALTLSQTIKDSFKSLLLDASQTNASWTTAWTNYINNPGNTTYEGIVTTRLRDMLTKLLQMAEHQLC